MDEVNRKVVASFQNEIRQLKEANANLRKQIQVKDQAQAIRDRTIQGAFHDFRVAILLALEISSFDDKYGVPAEIRDRMEKTLGAWTQGGLLEDLRQKVRQDLDPTSKKGG